MSELPLACFIHTALIGNGEIILLRQLEKLHRFGLYDKLSEITVGTAGPGGPIPYIPLSLDQRAALDKLLADPKITIKHCDDVERFEAQTLQFVYEYSLNHDAKVLYLHSKGATRPDYAAHAWRELFEYYLIEHHEICLKLLDNYDACAPNFCYSWPIPENGFTGECGYFGGNLWWANTAHLRRLPEVKVPPPNRFWCELWIGKIRWRRFICMFTPPFDICKGILLREDYENVFDFKEYVDWPVDIKEGGEAIERRSAGRVFGTTSPH